MKRLVAVLFTSFFSASVFADAVSPKELLAQIQQNKGAVTHNFCDGLLTGVNALAEGFSSGWRNSRRTEQLQATYPAGLFVYDRFHSPLSTPFPMGPIVSSPEQLEAIPKKDVYLFFVESKFHGAFIAVLTQAVQARFPKIKVTTKVHTHNFGESFEGVKFQFEGHYSQLDQLLELLKQGFPFSEKAGFPFAHRFQFEKPVPMTFEPSTRNARGEIRGIIFWDGQKLVNLLAAPITQGSGNLIDIKLSQNGWFLFAITEKDVFVFHKGADGKYTSHETTANLTGYLNKRSNSSTVLRLKEVWPKNDGSFQVTYVTTEGEKRSTWLDFSPVSLF